MNVNYIVSFNHSEQIMFDIELETKGYDYDIMRLQMQLAAYLCLQVNKFNVDDVWKISTAADWNGTWCLEHGALPSNFKTEFNGKFFYDEDCTLSNVLAQFFDLEIMRRSDYIGKPYTVAEYYQKQA